MDDATVLIYHGKIVNVGHDIALPAGTLEISCEGKHIYPSFIDLNSHLGQPAVERTQWSPFPHMERDRKGAFGWNDAIHADYAASYHYAYSGEQALPLIKAGFGAVLTYQKNGIVRGSGALVALDENENIGLLRSNVSAHYSFDKGASQQDYPSSLMGAIALLRQTYLDAEWYKNSGFKSERNLSLESFIQLQQFPAFFETDDKWNVLRADRIGDENNIQYIFKGSGNEYQRIEDIKNTKGYFILPLNFPGPLDLIDPLLARQVPLEEMKHWDWAPSNAAQLKSAQVPFVFTAEGLEDPAQLLKQIRKAAMYGLTEQDVFEALITRPALWIKAYDLLGSIEKGKYANLLVTTAPLLNKHCQIEYNWVMGKAHEVNKETKNPWWGTYSLNWKNKMSNATETELTLEVYEAPGGLRGRWIQGGDTLSNEVVVKTDDARISFQLKADQKNQKDSIQIRTADREPQYITLQKNNDTVDGWILVNQNDDQQNFAIYGTFKWVDNSTTHPTESAENEWITPHTEMTYPFGAYGRTTLPQQETVWIKNATLWTNEAEGNFQGDLLIQNGKIIQVGKVTAPANAQIIDGTGKHVTAGIIDEHSHIALAAVNEHTQSSSAEVEESRVVWPEDIDIYRQLAGGVTAAQLLHGSANAIGGQSALVKLRWGQNADQMLIENADGFIKFALGENVKQSNAGDFNSVRFPQTRMGVEQVYYDHFHQAREYGMAWKAYNASLKSKSPLPKPRKDLELEALLEILEKKRFITCHSYVQSEINMLMHMADSMGFRINTFTHILEGYKVADKMKAHGAAASSFSDWWAYKMEVREAIPHNGALMHRQGLVVAFNSDDAEMARRLNQEAAKAVKYGRLTEEEAWKFVTLNPAKMLHLDHRMGSLKAGKDADIVIWNNNPLSIYAMAEKTFVDGRCYFDREEDGFLFQQQWNDRKLLMDQMQKSIANGDQPQKP
ncbi:MAG: amidohydrolase family protein, partial [Bacteroidetes bacterium]|nr:amidohydrolase family protein [Bacteroidota bacterium]